MGQFSIISDARTWQQKLQKLKDNSLLTSFDFVNASTLLYPDDCPTTEAAVYEKNEKFAFLPYVKRQCPYNNDFFDICSAYEFGGIWFSTQDKSKCLDLQDGLSKEFYQYANDTKIVSEFLRLNPMIELDYLPWQDYEIAMTGQHIIIPLKRGLKKIWSEFQGARRTEIRRAIKSKLSIEFTLDTDTFLEHYYNRLKSLRAYSFYYFPKSFIENLRQKIILKIFDMNGDLCGVQLWLYDNHTMFYFLSADIYEKRHLNPSTFGIYTMINYAYEKAFEYIHLGGGNKSLYYFKALFSPHRADYFTAKRIFNLDAYNYLVNEHIRNSGEVKNKGFFPLYREDNKISDNYSNNRRYTGTMLY